MSKDLISRPVRRRTILKAGLAIGAHAGCEPIRGEGARRRAGQDRAQRSVHRHLCRARQERADRLRAGDRADQRQGRHSRPQGRAARRGLHQRRYRHRGAEGAQADRSRQGRLPARQRELGDGDRAGRGLKSGRDPAHRHRRPHRCGHRHGLPLERLPRLQYDAHGNQLGLEDAVQASTARSGISSPPTTRSATPCSRASRRRSSNTAAPRSARR